MNDQETAGREIQFENPAAGGGQIEGTRRELDTASGLRSVRSIGVSGVKTS